MTSISSCGVVSQPPKDTLNVVLVSLCGHFCVPFAQEPSGALRLLFPSFPSSAEIAKTWVNSLSHTHHIQYGHDRVIKLATSIMGIGRIREQVRIRCPETGDLTSFLQECWYPIRVSSASIKIMKNWQGLSLRCVSQEQAIRVSYEWATKCNYWFQPALILRICQALAELSKPGDNCEFSDLRFPPLPIHQHFMPQYSNADQKEQRRQLAERRFKQLFGTVASITSTQRPEKISGTPPTQQKRHEFSDTQPAQSKWRKFSTEELLCHESLDEDPVPPAATSSHMASYTNNIKCIQQEQVMGNESNQQLTDLPGSSDTADTESVPSACMTPDPTYLAHLLDTSDDTTGLPSQATDLLELPEDDIELLQLLLGPFQLPTELPLLLELGYLDQNDQQSTIVSQDMQLQQQESIHSKVAFEGINTQPATETLNLNYNTTQDTSNIFT